MDLGNAILKAWVSLKVAVAESRHRRQAPQHRLRLIWESLSHDSFLWWSLRRLSANVPRMCARKRLLNLLLHRNPEFNAAVIVRVPPILRAALDSRQAHLLLQIHERHFSIGTLFGQEKREHVRLVSNKEMYLGRFLARGFDPSLVHFVQRDAASLLVLRDYLRRGLPICCAVDHTSEGRQHGFVSPTMFTFAMRFDIPTLFVKSTVTDTGEIQLHCRPPKKMANGLESALDFIDFYNSTGTSRVDLGAKEFGS